MAAQFGLFKAAAFFDLIPGPDHFAQLFFLAAVAAIHIGMQHLDQGFIGLANFGLGSVIFGFQNIPRPTFRRRQFTGCPGDRFSRILRGIGAQNLMRGIHAKAGPSPLFFA